MDTAEITSIDWEILDTRFCEEAEKRTIVTMYIGDEESLKFLKERVVRGLANQIWEMYVRLN